MCAEAPGGQGRGPAEDEAQGVRGEATRPAVMGSRALHTHPQSLHTPPVTHIYTHSELHQDGQPCSTAWGSGPRRLWGLRQAPRVSEFLALASQRAALSLRTPVGPRTTTSIPDPRTRR